jgi:mannose-6-phosphate isomerase
MELAAPLAFQPMYQRLVWGGRRMEAFRDDLPEGPIGESWELADHAKGMSIVRGGPLDGTSLHELLQRDPEALVGRGFSGKVFPLMVKLIDAADALSVQVHPDDALARKLGLGDNGKTECWFMLDAGGSLFQGTQAGVDLAAFRSALEQGRVSETLNRFSVERGDFFFLEARTVHALGAGCLLYEIQQTSDITFRVHDWGRVGLDGKPRQLHIQESLETIDFTRSGFGPVKPAWEYDVKRGGELCRLADCRYFNVEQRFTAGAPLLGGSPGTCSVVICIEGRARLATEAGSLQLEPRMTCLVPAAAGAFKVLPDTATRVLVATPRF